MILETVDISDISQDPANVRKHSERNLESIAASLRAFGQQKPIVVDKRGVILAGNGTYEAAKRIGWDKIKITRTDLSGTLATAYAIADNRTAELAEWDDTALAEQLRALQSEEFDLSNVGYTDDEVQQLIDGIGNEILGASEVTEDEIPEPPIEPITKPGDLWLLGEHRLLCGDSTKADDVERLMKGHRADLMLTDPPYNVDYTGKTKDALKVANDSMADGDFRKFLVACLGAAFDIMKPGASFYVFHADSEGYNFRGAVKDCGQIVRQCLIWTKDVLVMGRQDYHWQHEPCLYGWKEGASHGWYSDRKQTTLLRFERPGRSAEHPTMKPVAMFAYLMGNSTAPQGLAYDPFLGSGTTLIAAEQLGRKCYGMEISPQYCDVIVKRWETLTGRIATRA